MPVARGRAVVESTKLGKSSFYSGHLSSRLVLTSVSYAGLFFSKSSSFFPASRHPSLWLRASDCLSPSLSSASSPACLSLFPSAFSLFCVNSWDAFVKGFHSDRPFEQVVIHVRLAVNWREAMHAHTNTHTELCNCFPTNQRAAAHLLAGASFLTRLVVVFFPPPSPPSTVGSSCSSIIGLTYKSLTPLNHCWKQFIL